MQILAIETELNPIDAVRDEPLLREEALQVWQLQKHNVIRRIWFTRKGRRAVVLLECPSEADAERHLQTLPLVRDRRIAFETYALQPYDGFDRLLTLSPPAPT